MTHIQTKGMGLFTALGLSAALLLGSMPILPAVTAAASTITVGNGGDCATINEAVQLAASRNPSSEADRITIAIAPGTYREQVIVNTPYLSFVNSNPSGGDVLLTWYYGIGYQYYSCATDGYYDASDAASKSAKGTADRWGTAVRLLSGAQYFRAENITFENSFNRYITQEELADGVEPTSETLTVQRTSGLDVTAKANTERAAAMCVEANYAEFYQCEFYGSQDTLYTGSVTAYFKDCLIQGNTDYIFGSGDIVFDQCELRFGGYSDKAVGGYITAAREQTLGYLFWNCHVTANPALTVGSGYFGRPWRATAHVLFCNTVLEYESIITDVGWHSMSGVDPSQATFREYNTTTASGASVNTSSRTAGTVLSSCSATREGYLNGWTPYYFNYTAQPTTLQGTLISELTVQDTANGSNWHIVSPLAVGSTVFGDRDFTYTAVPDALLGAEYVQTACDSKNFTGDLAVLTAAQPMYLYLAFDSRLGTIPAWAAQRFTDTGMQCTTSNAVTLWVYRTELAAGETITLGDNTTGTSVIGYTLFAQGQPIVYQGTLIRDLNLIDRTNGANWGIEPTLSVGSLVFGDRDVTFTAIPDSLLGAEYIRTACDSKYTTGILATAVAQADVLVTVGIDSRIAAPAWLNDWTNTGMTCSASNDVTFILYQHSYAAGEIMSFGENGTSATCVNYIAMVQNKPAETATTTAITTTTTTTTAEITASLLGDVDENGIVNISDAVLLCRYLAEDANVTVNELGRKNADYDANGILETKDISALLQSLAKLEA